MNEFKFKHKDDDGENGIVFTAKKMTAYLYDVSWYDPESKQIENTQYETDDVEYYLKSKTWLELSI